MAKRIKIEHEDEVYTSRKLAVIGNWCDGYARQLLSEVNAGVRTITEVLRMAKNRKIKTSRKKFKYVHKVRVGQRVIETVYTLQDIVENTGLTTEGAWLRMRKIVTGKLPIENIFDTPRGADRNVLKPKGRFSHLSGKMTADRKEKAKILEKCSNQNEWLRS